MCLQGICQRAKRGHMPTLCQPPSLFTLPTLNVCPPAECAFLPALSLIHFLQTTMSEEDEGSSDGVLLPGDEGHVGERGPTFLSLSSLC